MAWEKDSSALARAPDAGSLAHAARPHLVIILVDDVGYNDVGWHNSHVKTPSRTPFLTGLLRKDSETTVELLRHYTFSICSPTRPSLLTGTGTGANRYLRSIQNRGGALNSDKNANPRYSN